MYVYIIYMYIHDVHNMCIYIYIHFVCIYVFIYIYVHKGHLEPQG